MQLFFNKDITTSDKKFVFDKIESKHIVRVLRKEVGDIINITNGQGYLFQAEVVEANVKKCVINVISFEKKEINRNYSIHIAIAPTKSNERFEWFLEKATEIGIDEITPVFCDNSERKVLKTERLHKIIEAAAKQSLKFNFPKLNEPIQFESFITNPLNGAKFIAHCDKNDIKTSLKKLKLIEGTITILIGPEGDFSPREINTAKEKEFKPITLGESRLRTETAGIVAVHTISLLK